MKTSVSVSNEPKPSVISPSDMRDGEYGIVVTSNSMGPGIGDVLLRCYEILVSITKPSSTWSHPTGTWPNVLVRKLSAGEVLTITIQEN